MLAFLDAFCEALLARDVRRVSDLLTHPLAGALPAAVRAEASAVLEDSQAYHAAPVHALRLRHLTAHLLGMRREPLPPPASAGTTPTGVRAVQMELELPSVAP